MNKVLLFIALVFSASLVSAQNADLLQAHKGNGHIFGIVNDTVANHIVEFANVALVDPATGKPVDGTICDMEGKFSITKVGAGTYNVVVSFIGLETRTISNVVVPEKKSDINLGTVNIGPVAKLLKEVTVEGQRTLIEEKVDRTVYNAEVDQTTKGGDATDVLKRVPMLSVDMDGNVSLRGSQNIKVLINNKPSTMMASSIADALKQIPADQIKSVEVITSPSAKYDAEGSAGIINIITKKNTLQGATLNINGSSGYRGTNLGLNGSYRKGKMGFTLGGFGRAGYNIVGRFENDQITSDQAGVHQTFQNAATRSNNLGGNYTLGWDYDINKTNSVAASVRFGARNNYAFQDHLQTQAYRNDSLQSTLLQNVKTTDLSGTMDVNFNYTHLFEKPQREFSLLALYSRNNRTNDFVRSTLNSLEADSMRTKNDNNSYNQEMTVQADYQTPIGKTQLVELGGKGIMRNVSSNYQYYTAPGSDGPYTPNMPPLPTANLFNYNQNIAAGYLSYTLTLPAGYSFKAGTRYEYTTISANFQNASDIPTNIPSYGVLVPSVNLSKKIGGASTLKMAFNRRIQRPSIQYLNPNITYSNPYSVSFGNPNLNPEYTNNYELGYSSFIKQTSFSISGFARNTTGSIQSVKSTLPGGIIQTTYQNIGQEDAYGSSIFMNVNISNKFTLSGGGDVYYAILKNNLTGSIYNASNQGWVYSGRLFGNYTVGKGWGLQFFTFYRGRQVQLQGTQGGFRVYSLSIQKELLNKKGSLGFGADNFFSPSINIRSKTIQPGVIEQHSLNVLHTMNFKVTFSYKIGKMSFDAPKKRRKSISNDDMKDGGGDTPTNVSQGQQQQGNPNGQNGQDQNGKGKKSGDGKTYQKPDATNKQDSTKQNFRRDDFTKNPMKGDSTKQDSTKQDFRRDDFMKNPIKGDSTKPDTTKLKTR